VKLWKIFISPVIVLLANLMIYLSIHPLAENIQVDARNDIIQFDKFRSANPDRANSCGVDHLIESAKKLELVGVNLDSALFRFTVQGGIGAVLIILVWEFFRYRKK